VADARVVVRLHGGATESLPAAPLPDGRFRLLLSASLVPLARGDVVTCVDGYVADVAPGDAVLTVFQPSPDADLAALTAFWEATGAGVTTEAGPFLVTDWPSAPMDAVAQQLNADEDAGRGTWILAAEASERRREAQEEVDFG
jgi:hypothetical protein